MSGRFVQQFLRSISRNVQLASASFASIAALLRFASTALSHRVLPSIRGFGGIQDFRRCGNRRHVAGGRLPAKGVRSRRLTVLCPASSPMRHNKSFKPNLSAGAAKSA